MVWSPIQLSPRVSSPMGVGILGQCGVLVKHGRLKMLRALGLLGVSNRLINDFAWCFLTEHLLVKLEKVGLGSKGLCRAVFNNRYRKTVNSMSSVHMAASD